MSRQSEIRRLEDLVAAVRSGRNQSLVIVGPAGMGKTWLCRRAAALASDFTVVATRGAEGEVHLGYGGLFDVPSPLMGTPCGSCSTPSGATSSVRSPTPTSC